MPKISEFFGIAIYIYFREHEPPHFHAHYGDAEAVVAIDSLRLLRGRLPPRALGLVMEWALQHQSELRRSWTQAKAHQTPNKIDPLQ